MLSAACEQKYLILKDAIKTVGVGKKGSKELTVDQIEALVPVLRSSDISKPALGAFLGGLIMKGPSPQELKLEEAYESGIFSRPQQLIQRISPDAPIWIHDVCVRLMRGETLDVSGAERVGNFLMDDSPGDAARGLIASILRVRYETDDEYEGLLKAISKTFLPPFKELPPAGNPVIQIAEPFDGVDQSNMITPLVARYLQMLNYRVVSLCGRNSGPKFGNNLFDIAQRLNGRFLVFAREFSNDSPEFGFYLNQKDLSSAMDRWVDIRHQTVKRPFMATLERFVNPFKADLCIASAFHPPYGEKMLTTAERAGFPKVIIIRNGIEGTIAFALKRPTKVLCSVKRSDGRYERQAFDFDAEQFLGFSPPVEENLQQVSPDANAALIREYAERQQTSNPLLDLRVKVTCAGLAQGLQFVNSSG